MTFPGKFWDKLSGHFKGKNLKQYSINRYFKTSYFAKVF